MKKQSQEDSRENERKFAIKIRKHIWQIDMDICLMYTCLELKLTIKELLMSKTALQRVN